MNTDKVNQINKELEQTIELVKNTNKIVSDFLKELNFKEKYFNKIFNQLDRFADMNIDCSRYQTAATEILELLKVPYNNSTIKIKSRNVQYNLYSCSNVQIRNLKPKTPKLLAYHILYDKLKTVNEHDANTEYKINCMIMSDKDVLDELYKTCRNTLYTFEDDLNFLCGISKTKQETLSFKFSENVLLPAKPNADEFENIYILDKAKFNRILKNKENDVKKFKTDLKETILNNFPALLVNIL